VRRHRQDRLLHNNSRFYLILGLHFISLTTDSAPVNDVIVGTAVRSVHDEDGVPYTPDMHIHCIDHIINIVAQAFLAGLDLGMTPVRKVC